MVKEYDYELFRLYEPDLKERFCSALDRADLEALESAYEEAEKLIKRLQGVRPGPRGYTNEQKQVRWQAWGCACLAASNRSGLSYSATWIEHFSSLGDAPRKPRCHDPEARLQWIVDRFSFCDDILDRYKKTPIENKK